MAEQTPPKTVEQILISLYLGDIARNPSLKSQVAHPKIIEAKAQLDQHYRQIFESLIGEDEDDYRDDIIPTRATRNTLRAELRTKLKDMERL